METETIIAIVIAVVVVLALVVFLAWRQSNRRMEARREEAMEHRSKAVAAERESAERAARAEERLARARREELLAQKEQEEAAAHASKADELHQRADEVDPDVDLTHEEDVVDH